MTLEFRITGNQDYMPVYRDFTVSVSATAGRHSIATSSPVNSDNDITGILLIHGAPMMPDYVLQELYRESTVSCRKKKVQNWF